MKYLIFNILFLVFGLLAASAQNSVTIDQEIRSLGEVPWQQPKTVTFELKNTSTSSWRLTDVHASCGCTQVIWPREDIKPEETATLQVIFDARQLGSFQKEIEVYTSASAEPIYLTLQGRVVTTVTDYEDSFPIDLGSVRLNNNVVAFDDVNRGEKPEVILQVVNTSRESYKPELMHLPSYLSARYIPELLAGGRVGRIHLTLDSEKLKNYGLTETTIYLARHLGDKVGTENEIDVSAVLLPSFAHLSAAELATAPQLSLSQDSLDFSALAGKKKLTQTLLIQNSGQSPLEISNMQVQGKGVAISLSSRTIAPGKSAKLKVTIQHASLQQMKNDPHILLITNDPAQPKKTINIYGASRK